MNSNSDQASGEEADNWRRNVANSGQSYAGASQHQTYGYGAENNEMELEIEIQGIDEDKSQSSVAVSVDRHESSDRQSEISADDRAYYKGGATQIQSSQHQNYNQLDTEE